MSGQLPATDISLSKKILLGSLTAALALLAILVLGEIGARLFYQGHPLPESPPPRAIDPYRPKKFAGRWAMSSAYLSPLLDDLRRRNIQVLLASLCSVTLSAPTNEAYAAHCSSREKHSRQWAREHRVPYLSLVPAMQKAFAAHPITEVLILNDFHPTPLTHNLLADALYPFVTVNLAGAEPDATAIITGSRKK